MHLFWERGYEPASMADLLEAMGIRSPSLYAAFGDKARLFLQAVDRYQAGPGRYAVKALALAPTRHAISMLLAEAARHFTAPSKPTGCLVVLAGLACDPAASPEVAAALAAQRLAFEDAIRARLARGRDEGDVPPGADLPALARYVVMTFQGLALSARQGRTQRELLQDAERAMDGWPMG